MTYSRGERIEYTDLIVEKRYPIGYITINRPEKRNTLTTTPGGTVDQLAQAYTDMAVDPEIRVFILKGAGDCFCAGFDIAGAGEGRQSGWAKGREREPWARMSTKFQDPNAPECRKHELWWWPELWDNPKPSIALVHSFCLGAGLWNANLCDITYASPTAVFAYPPIRWGCSIYPAILPPWLLGLKKSMEMAMTGRYITAEEAYNFGLISRIVPEDKLLEEGQKLAESIARVPPMTNHYTKRAIHEYFEGLGIKQWNEYAYLACMMMEENSLPGHPRDMGALTREKGFVQGYGEFMDKWGYPDEVRNQETARLKALKGGKNE